MQAGTDPRTGRLVRALGLASLALAVPKLAAPTLVATAAGVEDSLVSPAVVRAAGVREVGHALALLTGPSWLVWTRVGADAVDLATLAAAIRARQGDRRTRVVAATALAAGVAAVDLYVGGRVLRGARLGRRRARRAPLVDEVPDLLSGRISDLRAADQHPAGAEPADEPRREAHA